MPQDCFSEDYVGRSTGCDTPPLSKCLFFSSWHNIRSIAFSEGDIGRGTSEIIYSFTFKKWERKTGRVLNVNSDRWRGSDGRNRGKAIKMYLV